MLFLLHAHVKQPMNMTQKELHTLWIKEAEAGLGAKKAGVIKALYKVSGKREVVAIVDVPSHRDLDKAIAGLPFNKESGLLDFEILPIHPYEEFAEDMKEGLGSG